MQGKIRKGRLLFLKSPLLFVMWCGSALALCTSLGWCELWKEEECGSQNTLGRLYFWEWWDVMLFARPPSFLLERKA